MYRQNVKRKFRLRKPMVESAFFVMFDIFWYLESKIWIWVWLVLICTLQVDKICGSFSLLTWYNILWYWIWCPSLGPILFFYHINDLPDAVKSSVRLIADDCLLYREINSQNDHILDSKYQKTSNGVVRFSSFNILSIHPSSLWYRYVW
jgi:hypothetical protein